jgi:hypothetical protein
VPNYLKDYVRVTLKKTSREIGGFFRETIEEWSPLNAETEENGDSRSTYERGPSLDWFVELILSVQEIYVLPWVL